MNARTNKSAPLFSSEFNRRNVLKSGLLGASALAFGGTLLSACGGGDSAGDGKKIVVADWGGAIQDAEKEYLYGPFTKETGIEIVLTDPPTDVKVKTQVDSGNVDWDLIAGGFSTIYSLGSDYFEDLPQNLLTIDGVAPEFVNPQGVAYYLFSVNAGWNTDALGSKKMENWADFFDTAQFTGKRSLQAMSTAMDLEAALLADGVPVKDIYPMDIDRAFKKLEEIKSQVPQWWESGSQPGQMLVGGQVSASSIWSGRVFTLQEEGAPIDFTWNEGYFQPAAWIVPKGAKNKDAAFQLIEYSLQPEVQGKLWGNYPCGPTNTKAFDAMPEDYAKKLPTYPDNAAVQFSRDEKWWADNREDVITRWNTFKTS